MNIRCRASIEYIYPTTSLFPQVSCPRPVFMWLPSQSSMPCLSTFHNLQNLEFLPRPLLTPPRHLGKGRETIGRRERETPPQPSFFQFESHAVNNLVYSFSRGRAIVAEGQAVSSTRQIILHHWHQYEHDELSCTVRLFESVITASYQTFGLPFVHRPVSTGLAAETQP